MYLCPVTDCTYACAAASSWDKWLESFENCLNAIHIGPNNIGKGLLLNSTGPKIYPGKKYKFAWNA